MCGRFTLRTPKNVLKEFYPLVDWPDVPPRYNIAPTQPVLAIRHLAQTPRPELAELRWGLVPYWADDIKIGNRFINARVESAPDKPAFRHGFLNKRCLILADGFYEWQKQDGRKQPVYIHRRDDRPFAFAGLWERWRPKQGKAEQPVQSCTILTTEPNEVVRPLHDRMPLILDRSLYERWLDPTLHDPAEIQKLIRPCPETLLESYPVGMQINDARYEDPSCISPVRRDTVDRLFAGDLFGS